MTQAPSVYGDLSVLENLRYFARVLGASPERVGAVIATVGLGDFAGRVVGRLSGGQRARASLATALLNDPAVLVLDEPTVGLDPVLRRDLWNTFRRLADGGTSLLVSSHVMDEADHCDRLLLMRDGGILAAETPQELRRQTGEDDLGEAFLRMIERSEAAGVNARITIATAARVLLQLRRDPRTIALLLAVPCLLEVLLRYVLDGEAAAFQRIGAPLLGIFPFISMFLVTAITMLRERTTGTLERLMSMPVGKLDLLAGYGLAFGAVAAVQAALTSVVAFGLLDLHVAGSEWAVAGLAIANAVLGMALGLFVSAFAATEFQAVQFMPAVVIPQLLLCGLFVPRDRMASVLQAVSDVLPLTYAYDGLARVTTLGGFDSTTRATWSSWSGRPSWR